MKVACSLKCNLSPDKMFEFSEDPVYLCGPPKILICWSDGTRTIFDIDILGLWQKIRFKRIDRVSLQTIQSLHPDWMPLSWITCPVVLISTLGMISQVDLTTGMEICNDILYSWFDTLDHIWAYVLRNLYHTCSQTRCNHHTVYAQPWRLSLLCPHLSNKI